VAYCPYRVVGLTCLAPLCAAIVFRFLSLLSSLYKILQHLPAYECRSNCVVENEEDGSPFNWQLNQFLPEGLDLMIDIWCLFLVLPFCFWFAIFFCVFCCCFVLCPFFVCGTPCPISDFCGYCAISARWSTCDHHRHQRDG
jgi:hypothetical protein